MPIVELLERRKGTHPPCGEVGVTDYLALASASVI